MGGTKKLACASCGKCSKLSAPTALSHHGAGSWWSIRARDFAWDQRRHLCTVASPAVETFRTSEKHVRCVWANSSINASMLWSSHLSSFGSQWKKRHLYRVNYPRCFQCLFWKAVNRAMGAYLKPIRVADDLAMPSQVPSCPYLRSLHASRGQSPPRPWFTQMLLSLMSCRLWDSQLLGKRAIHVCGCLQPHSSFSSLEVNRYLGGTAHEKRPRPREYYFVESIGQNQN